MTIATCENCRYYFFGFCRRYPPTVFVDPESQEDETLSQWPAVEAEDWCGEHQFRQEVDDKGGGS